MGQGSPVISEFTQGHQLSGSFILSQDSAGIHLDAVVDVLFLVKAGTKEHSF